MKRFNMLKGVFKDKSPTQIYAVVIAIASAISFLYFLLILIVHPTGTPNTDWYDWIFMFPLLLAGFTGCFAFVDAWRQARYEWIVKMGIFFFPTFYYLYHFYGRDICPELGEESCLDITKQGSQHTNTQETDNKH